MIHENALDGFKVELRRKIHDRQILVIEGAMCLRGRLVACCQRMELPDMRADMPVDIHGDESRKLDKSRIDPTPGATETRRDNIDQALFEPGNILGLRQPVNFCGSGAYRSDRPSTSC